MTGQKWSQQELSKEGSQISTIARIKVWVTGDVLTASDQNGEFNNILNDYNGSINSSNIGTLTGTLTLTVATNSIAANITSSSTTTNSLTLTCDALTTGRAASITSNSADTGTRSLVRILNDNTAATGATNLELVQDAARRAMFIDQNADSVSLAIDAENTTANTVEINANTITTGTMLLASDGDALTTGGFFNLSSNSSNASARNLGYIFNQNSAAAGAINLNIRSDGNAANAVFVDCNGTTSTGVFVDCDGNSAGNQVVGIRVQVDNAGASTDVVGVDFNDFTAGEPVMRVPTDNTDPTGAGGAATGRIAIRVGAAIRYLAYY